MTGRFVAYHAGLAFGGEGGIRTLGEFPHTAFRVFYATVTGGARFGVVSVSPVPAESRLKSGFFARKALRDRLF